MAIITLLTDLGLEDHYVAKIKARILKSAPQSQTIDISHCIDKCNLVSGAYVLSSVCEEFENGTIHVFGIDALSNYHNRYLVFVYKNHFFVGPDNGFFSLMFDEEPDEIYLLTNVSHSFPMLEILIPAACLLNNNKPIAEIGIKVTDFVRLNKVVPRILDEKTIVGHVLHIDHFGNLITNVTKSLLQEIGQGRIFEIKCRLERITKIQDSYTNAGGGDCVALFNAENNLEIGMVYGNASRLLGLKQESEILINFH